MSEIPEQYYTPIGTKISRDKIVSDWIENYQQQENIRLTDFSEGSEIRNILESFALSVFQLMYYKNLEYRQHWLIYADGDFLDLHGVGKNLPRKNGGYAQGFIKVTLSEPLDYDVDLTYVSFINDDTGMYYSPYLNIYQINDDYRYIISAGDIEIEIPVVCDISGEIGNTDKNTVTVMDEDLENVTVVVTNSEAIVGGFDEELDDDYRSRLLINERNSSFGGKQWYENLCNSIDGVHDTYITFGSQFVKVFVNGNVKPTSSYILNLCLAELNRDGNHLLGHRFKVYEPNYIDLNLKIEINEKVIKNVTYGLEDETFNITEDMIMSRLQALIDGGDDDNMSYLGYSMGESLMETDIISAIQSINGVSNVTPYITDDNGNYVRFSEITCQNEEVVRLTNVVIEFREDVVYVGD